MQVVAKEARGAVDDHDKIEALFPKTYGRPRVELAVANNNVAAAPEEGCVRILELSGSYDVDCLSLWGAHPVYAYSNNGTSPRGPQGPLRAGVVLSGGQASGGHNVIAGTATALLLKSNRIEPSHSTHTR